MVKSTRLCPGRLPAKISTCLFLTHFDKLVQSSTEDKNSYKKQTNKKKNHVGLYISGLLRKRRKLKKTAILLDNNNYI